MTYWKKLRLPNPYAQWYWQAVEYNDDGTQTGRVSPQFDEEQKLDNWIASDSGNGGGNTFIIVAIITVSVIIVATVLFKSRRKR